jgi:guanine nucleotide-binding protein subunit alpha, other
LFLNKTDLFEEKLKHSDIKNIFPVSLLFHFCSSLASFALVKDYDGPPNDSIKGREYFQKRFVRLSNKSNRLVNRDVYTQYVMVWAAVQQSLTQF